MNIQQRYAKPLMWLSALLMTVFVGGCGGGDQGRGPILGIPAATLLAVAVTPAAPSVEVGSTRQFVATASYSDGVSIDVTTSANWTSANTPVATINGTSGLATGVTIGTSVITADFRGKTGTSTLTVTPALMSIALTPVNPSVSIDATQQLSATGSYSDGSTADVTSRTTFTSATPAVATVGAATGLATGVAVGTSVMTGTFGGKTATTTVTVVPPLSSITLAPANSTVLVGALPQFTAVANYTDGSTADITSAVIWTSSASTVATIAPGGQASALAIGMTTISATKGTTTASTTLTVNVTTIGGALTVNLGGAANFGVLAANSITNNSGGTTVVTGDVGSPSQTVDPVQAAGFTNYKSGAVLTTALADLQTAITDANSRGCDVNSPAGIDLGGQTFGPGVYCYAGAISITGTFTMSAPGTYIFRTGSTLNSTANSIVALNGASAGSIFWVPVGATTLGANSVFKGSILAQSAAITLGDNASLQGGRILSGSAATLRNNAVSIP